MNQALICSCLALSHTQALRRTLAVLPWTTPRPFGGSRGCLSTGARHPLLSLFLSLLFIKRRGFRACQPQPHPYWTHAIMPDSAQDPLHSQPRTHHPMPTPLLFTNYIITTTLSADDEDKQNYNHTEE